MLCELGHLGPDDADRVAVMVAERFPGPAPTGIEAVRRVAAIVLFPRLTDGDGGILAEDWPILFG